MATVNGLTVVGTGRCDLAGACNGCSTDADCTARGAYPHCGGGACGVQCRTGADGGGLWATDWCDAVTGLCVGCETDTQCDKARLLDVFGKHVCQSGHHGSWSTAAFVGSTHPPHRTTFGPHAALSRKNRLS